MMRRVVALLAIVVVVGGVAAGGWWYVNRNPEWWFWLQDEFAEAVTELGLEPAEESMGLEASGFIEAEEASVTSELGGRIVALHADEGDEVIQGQTVVELDDSLLLSRVKMAEAELAVAEAALAQVKAGVRQETLEYALALLEQARVAQTAAHVAWDDAQEMLENPQELELALTAARARLGVLDSQEQQAQAIANSAQSGRDFADEAVRLLEGFEPRKEWVQIGRFDLVSVPPEIPLPPNPADGEYIIDGYKIVIEGGVITVYHQVAIRIPVDILDEARHEQATATYQSWAAWTGLAGVQVARSGAEAYLAELESQRADPLTLQAQANAAKAQYEIATAAVGLAQAQVDGLQVGATPEQVAAVEAQVEIARAALDALRVQVDKFVLQAPILGLVLERPVHVGEVALPGSPLLTLADLDRVTLTVYVPEDQLGRVQLGQLVSVMVDAYPDRTFTGKVAFIASQAEFTPKNVQTREERVNMVFAVKVRLPNPDHALKPGMPADAVLVDAVNGG
jgi:HlyD family secretion protein